MARDETTPIRSVSPFGRGSSKRSGSRPQISVEDDDTPVTHEREDSTQLLMDALSETAEGTKARTVIMQLANHILDSKQAAAAPPPQPPAFTPESLRRWGLAVAFVLAVVAPVTQQIASVIADYVRPNQVVLDQLGEIKNSVEQTQTLQRESIAWTIDGFRSLSTGNPLPKVPPSLNLAAAQAEAEKDQ